MLAWLLLSLMFSIIAGLLILMSLVGVATAMYFATQEIFS